MQLDKLRFMLVLHNFFFKKKKSIFRCIIMRVRAILFCCASVGLTVGSGGSGTGERAGQDGMEFVTTTHGSIGAPPTNRGRRRLTVGWRRSISEGPD
jgi:hypothetical protein